MIRCEELIARMRAVQSRLPQQETEPGAADDLLADIDALASVRKRATVEALFAVTDAGVAPVFKPRGYLVLRAHGRRIKVSANVGACSECGALVEEDEHRKHVRWHLREKAS